MTTQTTFTSKSENELIITDSLTKELTDVYMTDDFFYNKIFLQTDGKKNKETEQRQVTIVMDGCCDIRAAFFSASLLCKHDFTRHKEYADGSIATITRDKYNHADKRDCKMKTIYKVCRVAKYCNYYDDFTREEETKEDPEDEEYADFKGARLVKNYSIEEHEDHADDPDEEYICDEQGDIIFDRNTLYNGGNVIDLDFVKKATEKIIKNNKIKQEKFESDIGSCPTIEIEVFTDIFDKFDECRKYFEDLFLNGNGLFSGIHFVSKSGEFHFHTIYKKPIVEEEEKIIKKRKTE
jgi:hypothetical protein